MPDYLNGKASPKLTRQEATRLWRQMRRGNQEARDTLLLSVLPLIVKESLRYRGVWCEADDIIQVGILGALKALDKWTPRRGALTTFITPSVRHACYNYLTSCCYSAVRLPTYARMLTVQAAKYGTEAVEASLSPVTVKTFRKAMQAASVGRIEDLKGTYREPFRLHEREFPSDVQAVVEALEILPKRERHVVELYYGIGCQRKTLEQVGKTIGVTRERVRQILAKAYRRIRSKLRVA